MIALVLIGVKNPALNWDMLGYVASAKHFEISSPVELHSFVFTNLKDYVDPDRYFSLTNGGNQYRIDMATNPDLFYQQLPYYEIRPAYTLSVLLASKLGLNIFTSTFAVSIISAILGVFLLAYTIKDKVYFGFLYAFPFFLMFFGILSIAKTSTPDAMVFLSLSIFIYLFSREKISLLLIIIPIYVLVRTDMIIFNSLILIVIFFLYKNYKIGTLLSFLITVALYLYVNHFFHNYGWSTIFSVTLIERVSNPADVSFTVSIADYLHVFIRGIISALNDRIFLGFISIMFTTLVLISFFAKSLSKNKEIWVYTAIPILYISIHVVLFPVTWDRFFIGFYTMAIIATLILLSKLIRRYEKLSTL